MEVTKTLVVGLGSTGTEICEKHSAAHSMGVRQY